MAKVTPILNTDLKSSAPDAPLVEGSKALGGPGKFHGCGFGCCGAPPKPVDPQKILDDGGKYVELPDGRILEYFVYGSDKKDARVLIQLNGSAGTGRMFALSQIPMKCNELNIKGIGITLPGHAYSTVNVGRRVVDFVADFDCVLQAENVDKFFLEGTSYGSSHAMGMAWFYSKQQRVLGMHLHVPYINRELADLVTPGIYAPSASGGTQDSLQSQCCPFCLLSFGCCCLGFFSCCMSDVEGYPGSAALEYKDTRRSASHSVYGIAFNNADDHCSMNWGFDVREIKLSGSKVLVSYALDDDEVPPEHGKWLARHFDAAVNIRDIGQKHKSFAAPWLKGHLLEQLVNLIDGRNAENFSVQN